MEWSGWDIEAMSFIEPSACAYSMHGSTGGDSGLARAFEDGARSIKHNLLSFERRALHLLLWQDVVYLRSNLVCICLICTLHQAGLAFGSVQSLQPVSP